MRKSFTATIVRQGPMCYIPVPFDPKDVFGKLRAPVKVTLNGLHVSQHHCRDGRATVYSPAKEQGGHASVG